MVPPLSGPAQRGIARRLSGQVCAAKRGMLADRLRVNLARSTSSELPRTPAQAAGFEARLLLGRALRPGNRLEAPVGDRLAALDGDAVGALLDPLLGPLDRLQVVLQPLDQRLVALVLEQLRARVGGVLVDVARARRRRRRGRAQRGELLLDALALARSSCLARSGSMGTRGGRRGPRNLATRRLRRRSRGRASWRRTKCRMPPWR